MNIKPVKAEKEVANYLKVFGSPIRIQILFTIGRGGACVCHLESVLNKRQAYISQHLMVMRDTGILETRRDGKFIFYRVADCGIFDLIKAAADNLALPPGSLPELSQTTKHPKCDCPHCLEEG